MEQTKYKLTHACEPSTRELNNSVDISTETTQGASGTEFAHYKSHHYRVQGAIPKPPGSLLAPHSSMTLIKETIGQHIARNNESAKQFKGKAWSTLLNV